MARAPVGKPGPDARGELTPSRIPVQMWGESSGRARLTVRWRVRYWHGRSGAIHLGLGRANRIRDDCRRFAHFGMCPVDMRLIGMHTDAHKGAPGRAGSLCELRAACGRSRPERVCLSRCAHGLYRGPCLVSSSRMVRRTTVSASTAYACAISSKLPCVQQKGLATVLSC